MAAWDLYARTIGQPLSAVLGGTRDRIASGVSIGIQDSLDQLLEKVEKELAAGYQRIKIKIKPGWDLDAVERVRATFRRHPADGRRQRRLLARRRRAPGQARSVRPDDDRAAARLRRRDGPRAAAAGRSRRRSASTSRSTPCASPATRSRRRPAGSSTSSRAASAATASRSSCTTCARRTAFPVWHGGMLESGIGRAHNIHLASLPNFTLPGDIAASKRYYEPDLIEPGIEVSPDGTIAVPTGPGIGVNIVRRARRTPPRCATSRSTPPRCGRRGTRRRMRRAGRSRGGRAAWPASCAAKAAAGGGAAAAHATSRRSRRSCSSRIDACSRTRR